MAFGFNEFPNVSYHDADLRELIRLYNELTETYNSLQADIQEALDYISQFESSTDEKIKEQIAVTMSLYQQRLITVENMVTSLSEKVASNGADIAKLQPQIDALNIALMKQKVYIDSLHNNLLDEFHKYKNGVGEYIDGRLYLFENEIRDIVTRLDKLDVINPINGKYEDINKVVSDLYTSIQLSFGITAKEYDALQLTAQEYDRLAISAIDYSTKAYFIFWELRQGLMRSPFTGLMANYKDVIYKLADLHKCGFTAKQYDELEITAKDFDAWGITAFNYDWYGRQKVLKREGITASDYDKLNLTAKEYDSKQLTAYQFDTYGKALLEMNSNGNTCSCMSCNPDVLKPNGQR